MFLTKYWQVERRKEHVPRGLEVPLLAACGALAAVVPASAQRCAQTASHSQASARQAARRSAALLEVIRMQAGLGLGVVRKILAIGKMARVLETRAIP